jgi:hypothetical protein
MLQKQIMSNAQYSFRHKERLDGLRPSLTLVAVCQFTRHCSKCTLFTPTHLSSSHALTTSSLISALPSSRLCPLTRLSFPLTLSHRTQSFLSSHILHHISHNTTSKHTHHQIINHSTHHHTLQHTAMQFAPSSYTPTPTMMTSTSHRGSAGRPGNTANEIMSLVDEHLAWQIEAEEREQQRRGSVGTLIVDWDGTGEGYAFHRGEEELNRLSACEAQSRTARQQEPAQVTESAKTGRQRHRYDAPTRASKARARVPTQVSAPSTSPSTSRHDGSVMPTLHHIATQCRTPTLTPRSATPTRTRPSNDISINYTPTTNTAHGYCPTASFAYKYNGSNLHVQRDASPTTHTFHVPIERYLASKELPAIPEGTKSKVLGFVKKVMSKLDKVGVLGKMKARREGRRESWAV